MSYKHTQISYVIIIALIAVALIFGNILIQTGFNLPVVIATILLLFVLASFTSLQVTIDEEYLRIKFGYGIFWKKFLLNEISSVKTVKNHWYYGWGIRRWLWPKMWIFNISGFDAIEIIMKNGKIYRIGTDEAKKLEQEIKIHKS
ncbi:MAG: hypothetical protein UR28_C0019G0025 [Candidatus Peregrinibacteria bacterium GW2011_GWF2_33_10]|nr:MAG: hypothetical protein UR28_C0019G0025 [Candidatus Peregrinibacteria bacterium GW2011_GWF2_33_10]OGJ45514.1 MAG: hypothetical protein A2263_05945 [Candidatus Peregrinibacteria bacterium RIFOXYA2_FULL_33_21]OGJ50011.1 MAG: hypothetical protein A2307_04555 [Candidatus Peregrinibacteria bacterium RIFOXYB2_FULL_33_20]